MSYYVTKTDGTSILVLDGTKDRISTSLTLIGRLAQTYGEDQNENFLHLLENFALDSPPPFPIKGQLWFDTATNNLKAYTTDNSWQTVGSYIDANILLTGNLFVGANSDFRISNLSNTDSVDITNFKSNANISLYSNVAGSLTRSLLINGTNGLVEVNGNATANFGVATKIYVDNAIDVTEDLVSQLGTYANITFSLQANAITAANVEIGKLRANITAANVQISNIKNRIETFLTPVDVPGAPDITEVATIADPTFTGIPAAPTAAPGTNTTQIATTEFVTSAINDIPAIDLSPYANIASPTFTGVPAAPTASPGTNTTQLATTAFVFEANTGLRNQILANTASIANDLATNYAPKLNPTFTGIPAAPTAAPGTNNTQLATTAFVTSALADIDFNPYAPKASPIFTGVPTAPTAANTTANTQLATTAFVTNKINSVLPAGIIMMWSGSVASIPSGWYLCNGSNGTPDLRSKFIVGAGSTYSPGNTGGSANAVVVEHSHNLTSTTVTGSTSSAGAHSHGGVLQAAANPAGRRVTLNRAVGQNDNDATGGNLGDETAGVGGHTHTFTATLSGTTSIAGVTGINANLPPYYALAFIMKA